jgi:cell division protein FtsW
MAQKKKKMSFFTKGTSDYIILIVVLVILACGLMMVLSASSPSSLSESGDSYKYFRKQAMCAGVGLIAMFVTSKIDYRIYKKFTWPIYIGLLALLLAVGYFGIEEGGARRWIRIAGINFQPSELAKIGYIIFFASILTDIKKAGNTKKILKGFFYPLALLLPIIYAIFVVQNHFSATLLIVAVTCIQMFIVGVPLRYFFISGCLVCSAGLAYFGYKSSQSSDETGSFRISRVQTWLDPFSDPTGEGWQMIQSLYAIASGGLFGLGFGESRQKYLYLPEPHNDFIFAVLAEETGFVGCIAVIILFAIFVWRGIVVAMKAPDTFGSLIAIGIVALIGLQAIINIAVVTGTIPVTGMPLPFFSYGGTAIIVNLATVGILLNISKSCNQK